MQAAVFLRLGVLILLQAIACGLALSPTATAREITPAERRIIEYDTKIPACFDPAVLEKIASYFAEKEAKYWETSVTIAGYEKIRPVAWRPWGLDYIPRRFCTGRWSPRTSSGGRSTIRCARTSPSSARIGA